MKRKGRGESIDWSYVLGPLASQAGVIDEEEFGELERAIGQHSRRAIRLKPNVTPADLPFETEPVPWYPQGRFLCDGQIRPGSFLEFAAGDYFIQDAGSLLPIALAGVQPGEIVCDTCASPGGKSTAVLEQLAGAGCLLSNEVIQSRVDTLELALARSGFANYVSAHQSVELLAQTCGAEFDCVIVDAPCTGQSMLARGKQTLAAFSQRQICHSAARQQTILRSAVELVRPGGRLIYSTCTFAFAENEAIIDWLRELCPAWQPLERESLAPWQVEGWPGCYRLWPQRDGCSGGFAAGLVFPDASQTLDSPPASLAELGSTAPGRGNSLRGAARRSGFPWEPQHDFDCLEQWGRGLDDGNWYRHGSELQHVHADVPKHWLGVAHSAARVAESNGQLWSPSYAAACLQPQSWFEPSDGVELSDAEAVRFLAGESLSQAGENGWVVAKWRGRPLAWTKRAVGQLKNHLPKGLRGQYPRRK